MQIWLALDEPHNLSTGGFGDYDARFAAGRFRNLMVLVLGAGERHCLVPFVLHCRSWLRRPCLCLVCFHRRARLMQRLCPCGLSSGGLLPLTYAVGYIRLQGDARPSYLRAVEVAHYWLECVPQMFVCLAVGMFDQR